MKSLLILLLGSLFITTATAQPPRLGFCKIKKHNKVTNIVEAEAFKILKSSGIQIEEGLTLDLIVKPATTYSKKAFGEAWTIWRTDVLVYQFQDWVLKSGPLTESLILLEVDYMSSIVEDGSNKHYKCIETGKDSDQLISEVSSIKKL